MSRKYLILLIFRRKFTIDRLCLFLFNQKVQIIRKRIGSKDTIAIKFRKRLTIFSKILKTKWRSDWNSIDFNDRKSLRRICFAILKSWLAMLIIQRRKFSWLVEQHWKNCQSLINIVEIDPNFSANRKKKYLINEAKNLFSFHFFSFLKKRPDRREQIGDIDSLIPLIFDKLTLKNRSKNKNIIGQRLIRSTNLNSSKSTIVFNVWWRNIFFWLKGRRISIRKANRTLRQRTNLSR